MNFIPVLGNSPIAQSKGQPTCFKSPFFVGHNKMNYIRYNIAVLVITGSHDYYFHAYNYVAWSWENSQHFVTPQLVSSQNDDWETSAEIPY